MQEYSYRIPLMGTKLDVIFIHDEEPIGLFDKLTTFGQSVESQFSRFIPDSELSQVSLKTKSHVSDRFAEVLTLAFQLNEKTKGLFNPLLSPKQIGYNQDFNTESENFKSLSGKTNMNIDMLSMNNNIVQKEKDHFLDFGGFLKGWTAQKMSEQCSAIKGSIINLGGDVVVKGCDLNTEDFHMTIHNPLNPKQPIPIRLKDEALATSGTYKRKWEDKHHILDPQTQDSSRSDLISASIITNDAAVADALATVSIILGKTKAIDFLELQKVRYLLIDQDGQITNNTNKLSPPAG